MSEQIWKCKNCNYRTEKYWGQVTWQCPRCGIKTEHIGSLVREQTAPTLTSPAVLMEENKEYRKTLAEIAKIVSRSRDLEIIVPLVKIGFLEYVNEGILGNYYILTEKAKKALK